MTSQRIDLQGRCALVPGAARGIGAAAALVLAREGADVAVRDIIPPDETVEAIKAMGRRACGIYYDVSVASDVKRIANEAIQTLGHIDILVNNAGIVHRHSFMETSEEVWDNVVGIVMKGRFLCTQAVYPHMKVRGYGKIVNVSSISGIIRGAVSKPVDSPEKTKGRSGPSYAAAKGAVIALTRWIAKDAAKDGIYVNAIAPGECDTDIAKGFDYAVQLLPIARWGSPYDMAEAILFLASCASDYITGQVLNADGGWAWPDQDAV